MPEGEFHITFELEDGSWLGSQRMTEPAFEAGTRLSVDGVEHEVDRQEPTLSSDPTVRGTVILRRLAD